MNTQLEFGHVYVIICTSSFIDFDFPFSFIRKIFSIPICAAHVGSPSDEVHVFGSIYENAVPVS